MDQRKNLYFIEMFFYENDTKKLMVSHSGLDIEEMQAVENFIENIKHNGTDEAEFDRTMVFLKDRLFGRYPPK